MLREFRGETFTREDVHNLFAKLVKDAEVRFRVKYTDYEIDAASLAEMTDERVNRFTNGWDWDGAQLNDTPSGRHFAMEGDQEQDEEQDPYAPKWIVDTIRGTLAGEQDCVICGTTFWSVRQKHVTCSPRCKAKLYRMRKRGGNEGVCEYCGKTFALKNSRKRFCDVRCRKANWRRNKKNEMHNL